MYNKALISLSKFASLWTWIDERQKERAVTQDLLLLPGTTCHIFCQTCRSQISLLSHLWTRKLLFCLLEGCHLEELSSPLLTSPQYGSLLLAMFFLFRVGDKIWLRKKLMIKFVTPKPSRVVKRKQEKSKQGKDVSFGIYQSLQEPFVHCLLQWFSTVYIQGTPP